MALAELNQLPPSVAYARFLQCCGSHRWATEMTQDRPFESAKSLLQHARNLWFRLSVADWLEAFAAHPRIGDLNSLPASHADTVALASSEQAGAGRADSATEAALREGNTAYERRFGYLYIVCATGKTATEMLSILRERLAHAPEKELRIAATEQAAITRLRLEKLL